MNYYRLTQKNRLKEIDILKAIAFIFIIEQHTLGDASNLILLHNAYYFYFNKLFFIIAKSGVPIFLCISGILLFYSYSQEFDVIKYYKKKILYLYIPYVIWSLVYVIYKGNYNYIFMQILTGGASYHLWYMGMILRLFIYVPIILWIAKKIHKQNIYLRIMVFIILMLVFYKILRCNYLITSTLIKVLFNNPTELQERFINITPIIWIGYFIIGIYIATYYEKFITILLKLKGFVISSFLLLISLKLILEINPDVFKIDNNISVLLWLGCCVSTILFLYIISLKLVNNKRLYNVFKFISKYSYIGYIIQIIVIKYTYRMLNIFTTNNTLLHIMLWISVSFLSPLIVKVISLIPHTSLVTGIKVKKTIKKEKIGVSILLK